jgi:hypothetical protein
MRGCLNIANSSCCVAIVIARFYRLSRQAVQKKTAFFPLVTKGLKIICSSETKKQRELNLHGARARSSPTSAIIALQLMQPREFNNPHSSGFNIHEKLKFCFEL